MKECIASKFYIYRVRSFSLKKHEIWHHRVPFDCQQVKLIRVCITLPLPSYIRTRSDTECRNQTDMEHATGYSNVYWKSLSSKP